MVPVDPSNLQNARKMKSTANTEKKRRREPQSLVIHLGTHKSMTWLKARLSRMVYRPFETDDVPTGSFLHCAQLYAAGTEKDGRFLSQMLPGVMFRVGRVSFSNGWVSFAQVCWKFLPSCAVRQRPEEFILKTGCWWDKLCSYLHLLELGSLESVKMTPVGRIVSRQLHLGTCWANCLF